MSSSRSQRPRTTRFFVRGSHVQPGWRPTVQGAKRRSASKPDTYATASFVHTLLFVAMQRFYTESLANVLDYDLMAPYEET